MGHPLDGFRLKLHRANDHLKTLESEIEAWFEQQPYGIVGEYKPGPPEEYLFSFRLFDPPPRRWGLLIGEFAYQARSALDHLAWQLVTLNGNEPSRRIQFPLVLSPFDWPGGEGEGRLAGASDRHVRLIERLQPYNRLAGGEWSYWLTTFDDPLAVLSFLSNEDKHRVLIPTTAALGAVGYEVTGSYDVAPITDTGVISYGPLVDRAPLLHLPVTATGPEPKVEMYFHERVQVTIDHMIGLPAKASVRRQRLDVLVELRAIREKLSDIFKVFVREFG